jgi:hypothetical protein
VKTLFRLERRGDIDIPSGQIQKDYLTSRGVYRAIAARLTRQGRIRLDRETNETPR